MTRWWASRRMERLGVLLLVFALVAAACGGDSGGGDAADSDGAGGSGEVDPEGVLRIGHSLDVPQGVHFDPVQSALVTDLPWIQLSIGTLLRETPEGELEPFLAESYEVVDPQTVTMTVREGVTYTDGGELDAEAVRASVLRTAREPASEGVRSAQHTGIAGLEDVTVDGPLEVTFSLSAPTAGVFLTAMASREGAIVSPTQLAESPDTIDTAPAAAGPYVVEEFRPGQLISLRKNPEFYDAESWQVGGIDFVHTPPGPPAVNGLLSDTLDVANVSQGDVERVEADPTYSVSSGSADYGYMLLNFCSGKPPFDDERVRQAVQKGIDREALNELAYGGRGEPAYGLWPEDHRNFNPEVRDIVEYDPEGAAELLEEAGVDELTVDFVLPSQTEQHARVAEVLQQQLDEIGITVDIVSSRDVASEFIVPQRPGALLIPGSRSGVDKYGRVFSTGSVQALCGQARPEIVEAVAPAAATGPDDPAAVEAYQAAELMVAEGAYIVPVVYVPQFSALNTDRIGGEPVFSSGLTRMLQLDSVYVKR